MGSHHGSTAVSNQVATAFGSMVDFLRNTRGLSWDTIATRAKMDHVVHGAQRGGHGSLGQMVQDAYNGRPDRATVQAIASLYREERKAWEKEGHKRSKAPPTAPSAAVVTSGTAPVVKHTVPEQQIKMPSGNGTYTPDGLDQVVLAFIGAAGPNGVLRKDVRASCKVSEMRIDRLVDHGFLLKRRKVAHGRPWILSLPAEMASNPRLAPTGETAPKAPETHGAGTTPAKASVARTPKPSPGAQDPYMAIYDGIFHLIEQVTEIKKAPLDLGNLPEHIRDEVAKARDSMLDEGIEGLMDVAEIFAPKRQP